MSITAFLVILGCAVAGYWIVSSVMEPGSDGTDESPSGGARDADPRKVEPRKTSRPALPAPANKPVATRSASDAPVPDWYIVLDVGPDASRSEIQAAMKRRLAVAEADGDTLGAARITRAAETGLKLRR
jgi:hypothetical protein